MLLQNRIFILWHAIRRKFSANDESIQLPIQKKISASYLEVISKVFSDLQHVFLYQKSFLRKRPRESITLNVSFQAKNYLTLSPNLIECRWRCVSELILWKKYGTSFLKYCYTIILFKLCKQMHAYNVFVKGSHKT